MAKMLGQQSDGAPSNLCQVCSGKAEHVGISQAPAKALVPGLGLEEQSGEALIILKHSSINSGLMMVWPNALGGDVIDEYKKAKPFSCNSISYLTQLKCVPKSKICPDLATNYGVCHFTLKCCVCVPWSVAYLLRDRDQASLTLCAPCWDGAGSTTAGWIQLEKNVTDRKVQPLPI